MEDAKLTEVKRSFVLPEFGKNDIIIDGLFGTGLNKPLTGGFATLVKSINKSKASVISIDIPSGMFAEDNSGNTKGTFIKANKTFTFQFPKMAFFLPEDGEFVGEWEVLNIDLHPEAISKTTTSNYYLRKENVEKIIKSRSVFSHKGTFGHALLIAGSYGKMGAAVLSSKGCLRAGAGLLTVHVPEKGNVIMQTSVPEAMLDVDLNEKYFSEITFFPKKYNAVGIGPGLGTEQISSDAFFQLLRQIKVPLVLDADALNLLDSPEKIDRIPEGTILTPHVGEFNRLAGVSPVVSSYQRLLAAIEFAAQTKTYVVLKGAYTAVCTPERNCFFNETGNPGMATAGSGDALTGIILGLLAQGYSSRDAAILGVYLHGLAGDIAAKKLSQEGLMASDIIESLPLAFKEIRV
jgi:yjeF C-terminal region, hydroxyethylthiazole kinase-related